MIQLEHALSLATESTNSPTEAEHSACEPARNHATSHSESHYNSINVPQCDHSLARRPNVPVDRGDAAVVVPSLSHACARPLQVGSAGLPSPAALPFTTFEHSSNHDNFALISRTRLSALCAPVECKQGEGCSTEVERGGRVLARTLIRALPTLQPSALSKSATLIGNWKQYSIGNDVSRTQNKTFEIKTSRLCKVSYGEKVTDTVRNPNYPSGVVSQPVVFVQSIRNW